MISPETGKTLTNTLPLLETDCVRDLALSTAINRLFLLLETGDFWVMDTTVNPCELLAVWKAREQCSLITLCEVKNASGQLVSLLFGATSNGQILLFGHNGNVRYRTQIHTSSIINLAIDRHQAFIVTGSLDRTIRISSINQSRREIVSCIACINLKTYLPALVSFVGLNYAVCSEEGVVHMFELVENRTRVISAGSTKKRLMYSCNEIPDHLRSDDHVEAITCISPIPMLDLFVTCSRDGSIKVWDMFNTLVREILYDSPIDTMTVTSGYGDLVFGINERVDKIKAKFYLPPGFTNINKAGYVEIIKDIIVRKKRMDPEEPILFDTSAGNGFVAPTRKRRKNRDLNLDNSVEAIIHDSNFCAIHLEDEDETPGVIPTVLPVAEIIPDPVVVKVAAEPMAIKPTSPQQELKTVISEPLIDFNLENDKYTRYLKSSHSHGRPASGLSLRQYSSQLELLQPTSPDIGRVDEPANEDADVGIKAAEIVQALEIEVKLSAPSSAKTTKIEVPPAAEENKALEEKPEETIGKSKNVGQQWPKVKKRHRRSISVAPDGEIPNSDMLKNVEAWRFRHGVGSLNSEHVKLAGKKKKVVDDDKALENKKRLERKLKYREKLADLAKKAKEEKESKEAESVYISALVDLEDHDIAEVVIAPKKKMLKKKISKKIARPESTDDFDLDTAEEKSKKELQKKKVKTLAPIVLEQPVFPEEVQHLEAMPWFASVADDVFEEVEYKEGPYTGLKIKKLKVAPTSDGLLPMAASVFLAEASNVTTKCEVLNYIEDTHERFHYSDVQPIANMFTGFLLTGFKGPAVLKDFEIEFGLKCMKEFHNYAGEGLDFAAVMIQISLFGLAEMRPLANEYLTELGIPDTQNDYLLKELYEIYGTHYALTQVYFDEIRPWLHARNGAGLPSLPQSATSRVSTASFRQTDEGAILMRQNVETAIDNKNKRIFMKDNIASECHQDILKFVRTQLKAYLSKGAKGEEAERLKSLTVFGNVINDVPVTVKTTRVKSETAKERKQASASTAPPIISRPVFEILKQPVTKDICDALDFFLTAMEKKRQKEEDDAADLAKHEAQEADKRKKEEERIAAEMEREDKKRIQKERLEQRKADIAAEALAAAIAEKAALAAKKAAAIVQQPFRSNKVAPPKFWGRGLQTRSGIFAAHESLGLNAELANANFLTKQPVNSLPMERVRINPFGMYEELPGIEKNVAREVSERKDPMRRKFAMPHGIGWLADELDKTGLPKNELDYIRNGGPVEYEETPAFETRMKYYQF